MAKSTKKASTKVDAPAVVATPTKTLKKGKREAEEPIEKVVVSSKKQKVEEKKIEAKKEAPEKKVETSSDEDSFSSEYNEVTAKKAPAASGAAPKKESSSDEDAPAAKKASAAPSKPVPASANKKAECSSDESSDEEEMSSDGDVPVAEKLAESSSDESSDEEEMSSDGDVPVAEKTSVAPSKLDPLASAAKKKADSSSDESSNEETSSDVDVPATKKAFAAPLIPVAPASKEESCSDDESSDEDATPKSLQKPFTKKKDESEESESDEESSDDEPKTPSTPKELPGGSKTLFVGNLSFSVEQADVENFFKSAGEIVDIRFATGQDNSLKGFGHVEFATSEAAQKALQELNGHDLVGRPVRLEVARVRGAATPYSVGRDSKSSQNGRAQGQTVSVCGFSTYDGEELQVPKTSLKRATGDAKQAKKSKKAQPDDDSEQSFEESEEDEPQKKKIKSQKSSSLEESSEEEDSSKEEEEHSKTPKKNPKTPSTPMEQQGGSKTLFVGNLSFSVEQADVENFFKSAGEIVDIRFATGQDNSLKGFGHVEFATSEAAQKALQELNGHDLLGRPVRLELARERGAVTPYSGGRDSQSFQNGRAQGQTVFVRGFSTYDSEEQIRSALEDHFGSCGEITRISIPKKDQDGGIKGIAYVEFKEADSLGEALKLSGSQLGESTLYVDEAKPKGDSAGGGRGGGRGFGISGSQDTGGKFGGRRGGGCDGGARGRFGGGGKVRGGFNKPNLATAGNGFYSSFSISPEIIANTWKI